MIVTEIFTKNNLGDFTKLSSTEYQLSSVVDQSHIKWKHLDSPFGPSTYIRLVENDKTIGRAMLQPRLLQTKNGQFTVASVTDVLIDPNFRFQPINFINITKASGNVADFDVTYHTSNQNTEPFYCKIFKFPKPFSLRGYGFLLRLSGVFSKIIGKRINLLDWFIFPFYYLIALADIILRKIAKINIIARPITDDVLLPLNAKILNQSTAILLRNQAFLKWRFEDAPLWKANTFSIEKEEKSLGYIVTRKFELKGLNYFVLMDFLLDPDLNFLSKLAIKFWLLIKAIKSKADALFTMANPNSKMASICIGFPFITIPDKFLPHKTPIFMRAQKEGKFLETDKTIHLTLADLDYF